MLGGYNSCGALHWSYLILPMLVFCQAEMKSFVRPDALFLKQHFEKKLVELEEEKKYLQVYSTLA